MVEAINKRILIVDDDERMRELLERYLTEQGFSVRTVADGNAMDVALSADACDLLVLDLMLPGEDGLSICRRLRADKFPAPIVMLTHLTQESY